MSTHSTVPALKQALFTQFQSASALSGLQVAYSFPGDATTNSVIYLGDVRGTSVIPTMRATRKTREEKYTVDVWIEIADAQNDSSGAEATAFQMYGAVEDILANDPTLGGSVFSGGTGWATITAFELLTGQDDSRLGWAASLKIEIEVTARLS